VNGGDGPCMTAGAGHRLSGQGRHQAGGGRGCEQGTRGTAARWEVEWTRGGSETGNKGQLKFCHFLPLVKLWSNVCTCTHIHF
jgi:hypothetical protein